MVKIPTRPGEAISGHLAGLPPFAPADMIERTVRGIGKVFALAWLALVLVTVLAVAERYAPPITAAMAAIFGSNPGTALTELQGHLYAAGFLVDLSYAMTVGAHVRIDVFAERWSLRTKAWVELAGTALFLAPFAVFVLVHAIPSWSARTGSTRSRPRPAGSAGAGSSSRSSSSASC